MRLMVCSSILALILASSALADIVPFDPHVLVATGGDAFDIGTDGLHLNLSAPGGGNQGGGIFVFHNTTGQTLGSIEAAIQMFSSNGEIPENFQVEGEIVPPAGQLTTFSLRFKQQSLCDGTASPTGFCVDMFFKLKGAPIVGIGGNFILDFDAPVDGSYTGPDKVIEDNKCLANPRQSACMTDFGPNRIGEWTDGAPLFVKPIPSVPEPRFYAGFLLVGLAVVRYWQRRNQAAR